MARLEPVVSFKAVKKVYQLSGQTIHALDNVSFTINRGEMIAVVGPSGSGKSTLMHLMGCLDTPTAGTIEIAGEDISRHSQAKLARIRNKHIGFVFQMFNLLPKFNVLENVELPLIYAGIGATERRRRALESIEEVGLTSRIHNRPSQLSGGQSQRVAIARAIVNNPDIILADEPTGALDSKTGKTIIELFQQLHSRGNTIVIVTHDPSLAASLPRRLEISDGKIVADHHSGLNHQNPRNL